MTKKRKAISHKGRIETWKNGRRYRVPRSPKGTFVKGSRKIRAYHYRQAPKKWAIAATGRKHVAAYGRTLSNRSGKVKHNRIEITGQGKELYDALAMMFGGRYVPRKPYQHVDAEDLMEKPYEYLEGGEWIDREVES